MYNDGNGGMTDYMFNTTHNSFEESEFRQWCAEHPRQQKARDEMLKDYPSIDQPSVVTPSEFKWDGKEGLCDNDDCDTITMWLIDMIELEKLSKRRMKKEIQSNVLFFENPEKAKTASYMSVGAKGSAFKTFLPADIRTKFEANIKQRYPNAVIIREAEIPTIIERVVKNS
jgi:hypothetical protein